MFIREFFSILNQGKVYARVELPVEPRAAMDGGSRFLNHDSCILNSLRPMGRVPLTLAHGAWRIGQSSPRVAATGASRFSTGA